MTAVRNAQDDSVAMKSVVPNKAMDDSSHMIKRENDSRSDSRLIAASLIVKSEDGNLPCTLCNKVLATKWSFYRHLKRQHGVDTMGMQYKKIHYECLHDECKRNQVSFGTITGYRQHLEKDHNVAGMTVPTELVFDSFDDVKTWLAMQERKDMAKFVKWNGVSHCKGIKTWRYYCNRSGTYKSHGSGQRQLKSQGSCKTGHRCPAAVVVVNRSKKFYVTYYSMHYGHEKMLGHLSLAPSVRQHIAGQLAKGVNPDKILRDIRLSVDNDFDRSHLITRKDVHNIRRAYGIDRAPGSNNNHSNGSDITASQSNEDVLTEGQTSSTKSGAGTNLGVCGWVREMQKLGEDSPVLLFDQINFITDGQKDFTPDGLKTNSEFMLVLMNPLQRKMLTKFGRDRVCIDTTYGLSGYEFELTTLLVIDDYDEGFPVAFFCSSSITSENLVKFLESIKSAIDVEIRPATLICDEVPMLYNAWVSVMGSISKRLMYTQHIDRAYRGKNVTNLTTDRDKRQAVQKSLRACHAELRNIKHDHMETSSKGRRVDKCIDALFSFLLEKQFDRLAKLHKGKLSSKVANLLQGHADGGELMINVVPLGNNQWQVPSASVPHRSYVVQRTNVNHVCSDSCAVVCKQCSACLDNMTCTCDVFQIVGNMCKHIHAVCMAESMQKSDCESSAAGQAAADQIISKEAQNEIQFYMSTLRGTKCAPSRFETAHNLLQEIQSLMTNELDIDSTAMSGVVENLKAARGLLIMNKVSKFTNTTLSSRGRSGNKPEKRSIPKTQQQKSQHVIDCNEYDDGFDGLKRIKLEQNQQPMIAVIETIEPSGAITVREEAVITDRDLDRSYITSLIGLHASDIQPSHSDSLVTLLEPVNLTMEELLAVQEGEELSERHVALAMSILRKQFPAVGGLESPIMCQTIQGFTAQLDNSVEVAQIHYAGGPLLQSTGHQWVTSSRCPGHTYATIYDPQISLYDASSRPQINSSLQNQMAQLYRSSERDLHLVCPEISWQIASTDSALYAIAAAVDICFGNTPMNRDYTAARMRSHLITCFQQQRFEPFPGSYISQPNTSYYLTIPVYCYCRRPGDDDMVECSQCFESFHCQCVQYTGGDFKCSACCSNNQLDYIISASQLQG